ncbi:Putative NAD-dependent epimerase/dehydratase, NAD(P)-binding domain superfamily [Septoria linicola]|uniref:NAD-dependent epimerase/dehydratase, NAD(P)-binding domain superfamily n=1 Tax=Septoria linicola TaxID=215465 RepID=A0A9Q9EGX6_9PEZI|nr:putative NAD-dependent epimerase/dehydratase, NAD(P)-binding domain superfamily [Septoria linicola]USW51226.1 Putative NAD-dependent epimerase/dehydratase, NAD(P)-binding domain superfamily [Septoria linicola]
MSSTGKSVFIVGPGFIGWNVLDILIDEGYQVTGFVRRKEHGEQIKASGAAVIFGDLNDKEKITEQAAKHDIILHTATADHLPSAEAVLEGIKQRSAKGLSAIFIHTSGTSVLDDGALDKYKSDNIYRDDTRSDVDSVPDTAPHREIDLAIVKSQKELGEKAKIAIMIPPLIYGYNPKHGRLTIQIPTLSRFALKHGYAAHVGKGLAVESNIHVLDLARAYVVLLHHLEQTPAANTLQNPYYFCETTGDNEPSWYDVARAIGEGLHSAGKIKDPEPRELTKDKWSDAFAEYTGAVIGLNSRSRANRLRALGWKPTEKDWRSSYLEDELPEILKEETGGFAGYKGTVAS